MNMRINLKQTEITEALKQYIRQQGISLQNKTVSMEFTAGRKETGLSVEINIDDHDLEIPGLEKGDVEETKTTILTVVPPPAGPVPPPAVVEGDAPAKTSTSLFAVSSVKEPEQGADTPPAVDAAPAVEAAAVAEPAAEAAAPAPVKTTSLFN